MNSSLFDIVRNSQYLLPRETTTMHRVLGTQTKTGNIFLGNIDAAQNIDLLKRNNIGAVLSVINTQVSLDVALEKLWIIADDCEEFPIEKYFQQSFTFIEKQRERTNILIHCYAGISRSTTLVAAYLMQKFGWSLDFSMRQIQGARNIAQPNPGFYQKLLNLESKLQNKPVASLNHRQHQKTVSYLPASISHNTNTDSRTGQSIRLSLNEKQDTVRGKGDSFKDLNQKIFQYQRKSKDQYNQSNINFKIFQIQPDDLKRIHDLFPQSTSSISKKTSYLLDDPLPMKSRPSNLTILNKEKPVRSYLSPRSFQQSIVY